MIDNTLNPMESKKPITHTAIKLEPIAKNGSKRFGVKAICKAGIQGETQMEISMWGETSAIAMQKLMRLLSNGGKEELLLISDEQAKKSK